MSEGSMNPLPRGFCNISVNRLPALQRTTRDGRLYSHSSSIMGSRSIGLCWATLEA